MQVSGAPVHLGAAGFIHGQTAVLAGERSALTRNGIPLTIVDWLGSVDGLIATFTIKITTSIISARRVVCALVVAYCIRFAGFRCCDTN